MNKLYLPPLFLVLVTVGAYFSEGAVPQDHAAPGSDVTTKAWEFTTAPVGLPGTGERTSVTRVTLHRTGRPIGTTGQNGQYILFVREVP